jgi:hypothetical protein
MSMFSYADLLLRRIAFFCHPTVRPNAPTKYRAWLITMKAALIINEDVCGLRSTWFSAAL